MSELNQAERIDEVRGEFPDQASLDDAIDRLLRAGFDRADVSLPSEEAVQTPDRGADMLVTEADERQLRTLGSSGAAAAGALAAAGATIATGGAAGLALAAAVAGGAGAGAAAYAGLGGTRTEEGEGSLLLSVRLATPSRRLAAQTALTEAGGRDVRAVGR